MLPLQTIHRVATQFRLASLKDDFRKRLFEEFESDPQNLEAGLDEINHIQVRYHNDPYGSIEELKKYSPEDYENMVNRLTHILRVKLENIQFGSRGIIVFRALSVKDPAEFIANLQDGTHERLGIYWSFNRKEAQAYWGKYDQKTVVLLGEMPLDSVNYKQTIKANTTRAFSRGEDEITALAGKKVFVESVFSGKDETPIKKSFPA